MHGFNRGMTGALALLTLAGCAAAPAPASGPPATAHVHEAAPSRDSADVRFMQGMIAHHGQAVTMSSLVPARAGRAELRLMAERIDVSQRDEIATMEQWLRARGHAVPDPAHHQHGPRMPGMLSDAELAALAAASGAEFDRLFLEFMIRHHEGALVMVQELFASPGGGQESQIYQFAADVDADQRAEIERMRRLLQP